MNEDDDWYYADESFEGFDTLDSDEPFDLGSIDDDFGDIDGDIGDDEAGDDD